jgi:hypothetical protein
MYIFNSFIIECRASTSVRLLFTSVAVDERSFIVHERCRCRCALYHPNHEDIWVGTVCMSRAIMNSLIIIKLPDWNRSVELIPE